MNTLTMTLAVALTVASPAFAQVGSSGTPPTLLPIDGDDTRLAVGSGVGSIDRPGGWGQIPPENGDGVIVAPDVNPLRGDNSAHPLGLLPGGGSDALMLPGEILDVVLDGDGRLHVLWLDGQGNLWASTLYEFQDGASEWLTPSGSQGYSVGGGDMVLRDGTVVLLDEPGPPADPPPPGYVWSKVEPPYWLTGRGSCWKLVLI